MNILLFPSGSLVAKEIYDSLVYEKNIILYGTDTDNNNYSYFYFDHYIPNCPMIENKQETILFLKDIVTKYNINFIYPAFDKVIYFLKENEIEIGCKIIAPCLDTISICNSKLTTYNILENIINVPIVYNKNNITSFPVYCKPIEGYGSRDHSIINNKKQLDKVNINTHLLLELLTGNEYTIDCFSSNNKVLYCYARQRIRTLNGISVHSKTIEIQGIKEIADKIQSKVIMKGAWFFQVKYSTNGVLKLLEIACRLPGAMCVNRVKGINFPLLTLLHYQGHNVEPIIYNNINIECYKVYNNYYITNLNFECIYCDLDDTLIINNKVNTKLITFLYKSLNNNKSIILITRNNDPKQVLARFRLDIFDRIIRLNKTKNELGEYIQKKSEFIQHKNSIFIDDSFTERYDVKINKNIPCLSVSDIEIFN